MAHNKPSRLKNLTLAGISALTGLVALAVVLVALIIGLWLDSLIGQRGLMTICLLVLSVPLSLYLMTRLALGLVSQIQLPAPSDYVSDSSQKEDESFE